MNKACGKGIVDDAYYYILNGEIYERNSTGQNSLSIGKP